MGPRNQIAILDQEQFARICGRNYPEWGRRMSLAQYLERERSMMSIPWAAENIRTIGLFDPQGEIVSSFDAISMESTQGPLLAIASVFTPSFARKQGHAFTCISQALGQVALGGTQWSLLFSDIDPAYYARLGFHAVAHEIHDLALPLPIPPEIQEASNAERLDDQAIPEAIRRIREFRIRVPAELTPLPSEGSLAWQLERLQVYRRFFAPPGAGKSVIKGASRGSALGLWAMDWRDEKVEVLSIIPGPAADNASVWRQLLLDAQEWGAKALRIWLHPQWTGGFLPESLKAATRCYTSSVPMIRRATGETPGLSGPIERIDWV